MISATSHELLALIAIKPIPCGLCDRRSSIQLLRHKFIERQSELTNSIRNPDITFVRYRYHATDAGKAFLNQSQTETVK